MIGQKRIENYTNGLKEMQEYIINNSGSLPKAVNDQICSKYKMSRTVLTNAVELNYIKRISRGVYKAVLLNVQPIHGRKLIELNNEISLKSQIKSKQNITSNKISSSTTVKAAVQKKNLKVKSLTTPVKEKRKISILWGLISWSRN